MTMDDLTAKFNGLSASLLSTNRQKKIKEIIFDCEKLSAPEFMKS